MSCSVLEVEFVVTGIVGEVGDGIAGGIVAGIAIWKVEVSISRKIDKNMVKIKKRIKNEYKSRNI